MRFCVLWWVPVPCDEFPVLCDEFLCHVISSCVLWWVTVSCDESLCRVMSPCVMWWGPVSCDVFVVTGILYWLALQKIPRLQLVKRSRLSLSRVSGLEWFKARKSGTWDRDALTPLESLSRTWGSQQRWVLMYIRFKLSHLKGSGKKQRKMWKNLSCRRESNPGPLALATSALTTELRQPSTSKTFTFYVFCYLYMVGDMNKQREKMGRAQPP